MTSSRPSVATTSANRWAGLARWLVEMLTATPVVCASPAAPAAAACGGSRMASLPGGLPPRAARAARPGPAAAGQREREVLRLVAQGYTGKEMAAELYVSARTVQNHLTSVRAQLGPSRRAGLARWATEHAL